LLFSPFLATDTQKQKRSPVADLVSVLPCGLRDLCVFGSELFDGVCCDVLLFLFVRL